MSRNRRTALLVMILMAAPTWACGRKQAPEAEHKAEGTPDAHGGEEGHEGIPESVRLTAAAIAEAGVQTWSVQPVDLEHMLTLTGSVSYDENRLVHVASNVKGRVSHIAVDLGARVRKGASLITVESVDLARAREEFAKALYHVRVSSHAYERARALVAAKAISPAEFQAREGDHLAKKAAAEGAERALSLAGESPAVVTRLRDVVESGGSLSGVAGAPRVVVSAPFAGTVIERKVTPGELVEAMQPLVTVADLSRVWVFLQAYEKDLALLRTGLPATIRVETYPLEFFKGQVDFLGSVVDPSSRTVRVRATVANVGEKLRPGMFVKAQVEVPQPQNEARMVLAVPQSALQTLEGRVHVFVQTEPGVFARRMVETGHTFEGFTEVLAGVKRGDVIVTEGSFVLKSEFARATLADEH